MRKISIIFVEKAIKIPADKWVSNCHSITNLILKKGLVKGKLRYGHYLGKIKKGSFFDKGLPFSRHGWIEMKDGTIVDPTRWVFEGKKPYIYIGRDLKDEYDTGGQRFREAMAVSVPEFDSSEPKIKLEISQQAEDFILDYLGYPYITKKSLFWIGNISTKRLGKFAKEIYRALDKIGRRSLVPIDNFNLVMK